MQNANTSILNEIKSLENEINSISSLYHNALTLFKKYVNNSVCSSLNEKIDIKLEPSEQRKYYEIKFSFFYKSQTWANLCSLILIIDKENNNVDINYNIGTPQNEVNLSDALDITSNVLIAASNITKDAHKFTEIYRDIVIQWTKHIYELEPIEEKLIEKKKELELIINNEAFDEIKNIFTISESPQDIIGYESILKKPNETISWYSFSQDNDLGLFNITLNKLESAQTSTGRISYKLNNKKISKKNIIDSIENILFYKKEILNESNNPLNLAVGWSYKVTTNPDDKTKLTNMLEKT